MFSAPILSDTHVQTSLRHCFQEASAAFVFIDVQQEYFDRQMLKNRAASRTQQTGMPLAAIRIGLFNKALQKHAPKLKKVWVVHTITRDLYACRNNPQALRHWLSVAPATTDKVIGKNSYDAFSTTNLAPHLNKHGITTLILSGGLLEECVMQTAKCAMEEHHMNVVIMPDLTVTQNGLSHEHIRHSFTGRTHQNTQAPWLGFMPSHDVLKTIRPHAKASLPPLASKHLTAV